MSFGFKGLQEGYFYATHIYNQPLIPFKHMLKFFCLILKAEIVSFIPGLNVMESVLQHPNATAKVVNIKVRKGEKTREKIERQKMFPVNFQGAIINFHSGAYGTEWAGVDHKF